MKIKVGLVLVSYNASNAVINTLSSIATAKTNIEYGLILIDNNSVEDEFKKILNGFEGISKSKSNWEIVRTDKNLGFSGGNNIGIKKFLSDASFTHICLINSDVIVSNLWLDHLISKNLDVVSPVTNRADSEQCIPINYDISLDKCVLDINFNLDPRLLSKINDFSSLWFEAWKGNVVSGEATFFCVLIKRKVWEDVGILDETFFPGGFEDDDYCIRCRNKGYQVLIARDVFIHHWGSASFGLVDYNYFSSHAKKNKEYLESKHRIQWQKRFERPFLSYWQQAAFGLETGGNQAQQLEMLSLFTDVFDKIFSNATCQIKASPQGSSYFSKLGDAKSRWQKLLLRVNELYSSNQKIESKDFSKLSEEFVSYIEDIKYLFTGISMLQPPKRSPKIRAVSLFMKLLKGSIFFLRQKKGIIFFGGYCYKERESDGYFQRIGAIDSLFKDRVRIYLDSSPLEHRVSMVDRPAPNVIVLNFTNIGRKKKLFLSLVTYLLLLRYRQAYFHSVLQMNFKGKSLIFNNPLLKKTIDIHGVVPEEFRYHNDYYHGRIFDKHEELAMSKCHNVLVVTEKMKQYLIEKYSDFELGQKVIVLPIFPDVAGNDCSKTLPPKATVIYAGGLQKWQQVPRMLEAVLLARTLCNFKFYSPFDSEVSNALNGIDEVEYSLKSHQEVIEAYKISHFGFILRENIIVNHVACPTKLIEYFAMKVVPIVDSDNIGGFNELGMSYITLPAFINGDLPTTDAWTRMVENNYGIYKKLIEGKSKSLETLRTRFNCEKL